MLSGQRPFLGSTAAEVMAAILRDAPVIPSHVPAAAGAIVGRCLVKDPAGRFASAHDLVRALESAARRGTLGADAPAGDDRVVTVAVLPFSNASPTPDDEYLQ